MSFLPTWLEDSPRCPINDVHILIFFKRIRKNGILSRHVVMIPWSMEACVISRHVVMIPLECGNPVGYY